MPKERRESKVLGLNYGTAMQRLKKMILFDCIVKLGRDKCFRCSFPITDISQLSIEHKVAWLDESVELFWDLENIAFSHLKCNISHGGKSENGFSKKLVEFCSIEGHGRRRYNSKTQSSRCKECERIRWHEENRNKQRNKRRRDDKIRELAQQGLSTREIAEKVKGISHVTVFNVLKEKNVSTN